MNRIEVYNGVNRMERAFPSLIALTGNESAMITGFRDHRQPVHIYYDFIRNARHMDMLIVADLDPSATDFNFKSDTGDKCS